MIPRTGVEPFHHAGQSHGFDVLSFWRWASSDLGGNALRGLVAEYLVARAVGSHDSARIEWDAVDVTTPSGIRVEVKASGRVQSWTQRKASTLRFDVAPKCGWSAATNTALPSPARSADVYVFAMHTHEDRATADPLNTAQWEFLVLPASWLPQQRTIGVATLQSLGARTATFNGLGAAIDAAHAASDEARSRPAR